ncbi:MAG: hypothetical protein ABR513_03080 [Desulfotignum sp.]
MKNKEFFIKILLFRKNYTIVVAGIFAKRSAKNAISSRFFPARQGNQMDGFRIEWVALILGMWFSVFKNDRNIAKTC